MPKHILHTGCMLQITMPIAGAIVPTAAAPLPLVGTSTSATINGMPVCLEGDELPPPLRAPQPYTAPPYVTPGTGQFQIMLMPNNKTMMVSNGKKMLQKGTTFQVKFQVQTPAQMPTPGGPVPDPLMVKIGTAQFIITGMMVTGDG